VDEQTTRLAIGGMHCGACVRRVTQALEKLDGVAVVRVDVGSAEIRITGPEFSAETVLNAIERAGFTAAVA